MKLRFLIPLLFLAVTGPVCAQTYTTVTATKVQLQSGQLLPRGVLCFQATDQNDSPISFEVAGGGQAVNYPVCGLVTNGVAQSPSGTSTFQVPNPATTTPAGILYRITISALNANVYYCKGAQLSGASFNFDNFACSSSTIPAPGVVLPSLTVNGVLTVNSCVGCGSSSAGFSRYYPNQTPNGATTVFTFTGTAASNLKFQLFWNGLVMNEVDDYSISIAGGTTTVTCVRPPKTGDTLTAFF